MAELLAHGIYSVPEAAKLTGIPARNLRRWVFGYGKGKRYEPLWTPEYSDEDDLALSFHDLLEVRFVHTFRSHNISLQAIRAAAAYAREVFNTRYPFTCRRFQTDGRSIFAAIVRDVEEEGEEDEKLLDLVRRQFVFRQVVAPSLYKGIEYDAGGEAEKWYPVEDKSRAIVLDPRKSFGKPILERFNVPTEIVYHSLQVEKDARKVSRIFEIPISEVRAAERYEKRILERAGTSG